MKTRFFFVICAAFFIQSVSTAAVFAQEEYGQPPANEAVEKKEKQPFPLFPELLWSGAWESRHNLADRFGIKLTAPGIQLALRLELLDRRPASSAADFIGSFGGDTAEKAITQPGLGLYHLNTGSRILYGVLDTYGFPARIRNVWVRGAPYAQSRDGSGAELKTSASSTALPMGFINLETGDVSAEKGSIGGFFSFGLSGEEDSLSPALNAAVWYKTGKAKFALEGYYIKQELPERVSSTWFNEKPALPPRDTRLFAGAASFSVPAFALAADLAYSETFAFGKDFYGNLAMCIGDKPWRFSLAFDAAGSRYVDSAGANPGAGFRTAVKLERWGKKTGLFRVGAVFKGPGPDKGLLPAIGMGDFSGIVQGINRITGDLYYRFPANNNAFGIKRISFSADHDGREGKKVLDSGTAMAAYKLGPVNCVSEGKLVFFNHNKSSGLAGTGLKLDSIKINQNLSWTINGTFSKKTDKKPDKTAAGTAKLGGKKKANSAKKGGFSVLLSSRVGYEKAANKAGVWDASFSASLRVMKQRLTLKAAASKFPRDWEFTVSWRMLF